MLKKKFTKRCCEKIKRKFQKKISFLFVCISIILISGCHEAVKQINIEQFKNLTQVTYSEKKDFEAAISLDGKNMLFVSYRDGDYNIYMKKNINAKSIIKKTFHTSSDINPSFSPDSSKFAFSSNRNGNFDIFVMNTNRGSAKTQITESRNNDYFPNWSPDGTKITFSQYSRIDEQWYIWIKNIKTGELTQVSKGIMSKFLSDGKHILYKKSTDKYFELWVMAIDGENDTQITRGEEWGVGTFCPSPTGKKILFSTIKGKYGKKFEYGVFNDSDLWTIDIDGSNLTQITTFKGDDFNPFWTSTGEIYFSSNRNNYYNIWKFTPHW